MKIIQRVLAILIIICLVILVTTKLLQNESYAASQTISTNIDGINDSDYPGIKSMIKALQKEHPNWNFKVLYTGLDWDDVIAGEYKGHGGTPTNLVPATSNYSGEWICSICGTQEYDNGNWYCASETTIEYMMDPRNSLNTNDVFQFLQLSYVACTYEDLQSMVKNYSYLNSKSILNSIINIGKDYNVNPYYIIALIIQEQGSGSSVLVTGASYTGTDGVTYSGLYNAFNINASGNSPAEIYTNALKYASEKKWNTLAKSIEGGITTIADNYIKYGQDTMYFQKFNVSSTKYSYYIHQYMQNVLAAQLQGERLEEALEDLGLLEQSYTFIIPLYENMPEEACRVPNSTASSSSIDINTSDKIITTVPGVTAKQVISALESSSSVKNSSGTKISNSSNVGTGYTIDEYTIVVLGDVNGDGKVKATDYMRIKNYIMGESKLTTYQKLAADVNHNGEVKATDYMKIKNYIMGKSKIKLN